MCEEVGATAQTWVALTVQSGSPCDAGHEGDSGSAAAAAMLADTLAGRKRLENMCSTPYELPDLWW